ncbi:hypothetical protein DYI25_08355 [Mesobacillus boroniphilus]|uniref:Uncharacterized protein n=1 Tax=Mesobacillus boroniphilus TaxID=308892 RepID=A0A944GX87_9BACI|nr:hypothetical protein [Mesobacillus boroniphilus]
MNEKRFIPKVLLPSLHKISITSRRDFESEHKLNQNDVVLPNGSFQKGRSDSPAYSLLVRWKEAFNQQSINRYLERYQLQRNSTTFR